MSETNDDRATLRAFEGLASGYDRFRPRYPDAIVDALFRDIPADATVADIGCGTGISARAIAGRAARVIGVDPSDDMLATARRLSASHPTVTFVKGTAESTSLADASVDLVLVAQAFHWFDPPLALAEFHRILRPRGRCALLWNLRTGDDGFTDDYNRIVVSAAEALDPSTRAGRESLAGPLVKSPLFRDAETVTAPNPQPLDEEGVVGRATSASYFPRAEPERSARLAELRAAFSRHARAGVVVLRQVAQLTMATRR